MDDGMDAERKPVARMNGIGPALAIVGLGFLGLIIWMSTTTTGSTGPLVLMFAAIAIFQVVMDGHLLGMPFRDKARRKTTAERKPLLQAIYLVAIAAFAIFML